MNATGWAAAAAIIVSLGAVASLWLAPSARRKAGAETVNSYVQAADLLMRRQQESSEREMAGQQRQIDKLSSEVAELRRVLAERDQTIMRLVAERMSRGENPLL